MSTRPRAARRRFAAMVAALLTFTGLGALAGPVAPAGAAGMTTHAWMAESAIDLVSDPALRALLVANREQVRSGARFPDGGYGPGNVHGEEAHWQRFFDVHADRIASKPGCGDLTAPNGPCAAQIAHLLGAIGHGAGDEVWDWLFEPNSPDLDEYYAHPDFAGYDSEGGQEMVMDLVAIGVHGRPGGNPPPLPYPQEILDSLTAAGLTGGSLGQLEVGQIAIGVAYAAETAWARGHLDGVMTNMPWMSHNIVTAPGGVNYAAQAIAGQWDSMWGRLKGSQPDTTVSVHYPADGERRIPATGWDRAPQPGSHRDRGGARTRIIASLTHSVPYSAPGQPAISDALPAGSITITEVDSGDPVPLRAGFPKAGPYGASWGTHSVAVHPAADLAPCTWYRVDVTSSLVDARLESVVPTSWEFRTGLDGAGNRCADDPYTADENWIRAAYGDVLARTPGDAETRAWTESRSRGLTNGRFSASLVGSSESRNRIAADLYTTYLGRPADPAGRAFWADSMRTTNLVTVRSRVLGTPEVYAQAGGTNDAYIAHLYPLALGRPASPTDIGYWSQQLGRGAGRGFVAKHLFGSREAADQRVKSAYVDLLGRNAGSAEVAYWGPIVQRADERTLVRAVLASPEYRTNAQP